jgi:hypothetical protein
VGFIKEAKLIISNLVYSYAAKHAFLIISAFIKVFYWFLPDSGSISDSFPSSIPRDCSCGQPKIIFQVVSLLSIISNEIMTCPGKCSLNLKGLSGIGHLSWKEESHHISLLCNYKNKSSNKKEVSF